MALIIVGINHYEKISIMSACLCGLQQGKL